MVKFENMFPERVLFLFVCIQSPYHFIFPDVKNRTWWHCMCSVQTKKRKRKKKIGIIIRILMWSSSCLLVFWARLVKTCNKKGDAVMHWTVGQLIGLLQHPFVSDCIPLCRRMILNYFKPLKLYLIISNHKLEMAPLLSVVFTEICPVYLLLTVTLWSMNLRYKFLA